MIPSDLSDFNLYGGIYRYLDLVYVPALSVDKLFTHAEVNSDGKTGTLNVKARFYNPSDADSAAVSV
jgi:beta-galactosidase